MISAFERIEHIGIAVSDIESAELLYSKILNSKPYKREQIDSQAVITSFFKVGDNKIELLQATSPDSAIAKFIAKKGEGMHHIAYLVSDISHEIKRLSEAGFLLIDDEPVEGADNMLVAFLHPKSTGGTLIEICQSID
jgi:methylmalonyl-CoA/ethylmalonyl-CoA epimerase|tara:strand:+ start:17799 stop:18212 length:414 start_codon:yes stop_codon:yes gene_type:complete